jgi:hypothetical protein
VKKTLEKRSGNAAMALLAAVIAVLLAACSSPAGDQPDAPTQPAPGETAAATADDAVTPPPGDPTAAATDAAGETATTEPAPADTPMPDLPAGGPFYGVMQPVSGADVRSPQAIAQAMRDLRALGSTMTLQLFDPEHTPQDWRNYLDVAQQEGMLVIGRLGPVDWNPDPNDLSPILDVLAEVADHPALYGFVYLHEPWEVMTTTQMQGIYQELKAAHPNARLGVIWSGEIEKASRRGNPDRVFTDGLCDICIVNQKAFQNDPQLAERQGLGRLAASAPVVLSEDPDAELWSTVQVWAPPGDGGPRGFRVPSPEEMVALYCSVQQSHDLAGFMWASWTLPMENISPLASDALSAQRDAVVQALQTCGSG